MLHFYISFVTIKGQGRGRQNKLVIFDNQDFSVSAIRLQITGEASPELASQRIEETATVGSLLDAGQGLIILVLIL